LKISSSINCVVTHATLWAHYFSKYFINISAYGTLLATDLLEVACANESACSNINATCNSLEIWDFQLGLSVWHRT